MSTEVTFTHAAACIQITEGFVASVSVMIGKNPKTLSLCEWGWVMFRSTKLNLSLSSLDLKVSTVETDTTVSDSPFQFFIILLKQLLAYISVLAGT